MEFQQVALADWRAQVEKELAGRPFDKTLVHEALSGVDIAPLYTEAPQGVGRWQRAEPFRICMRHEPGASRDALVADRAGGADAFWLGLGELDALLRTGGGAGIADGAFFVLDAEDAPPEGFAAKAFALNVDPLARRARGGSPSGDAAQALSALGRTARKVEERFPGASAVMISTLPYHDAGADAADELAFALSTGVSYLEALRDAGLSADAAARQIALQVAVGRDTFLELCKVRALRICWAKLLVAAGGRDVAEATGANDAKGAARTNVHAVCSSRTLTVRDPWVNLLRITTQVFAAVLGGADWVTPQAFDRALGAPSAQAHRIARNTGLVLREESFLGKVMDPAGGSYYLDTLTDALAREGWKRFRALEQEGGIVSALESGRLAARLEAAWRSRLSAIASRKTPILGVSEFANLDEELPRSAPAAATASAKAGGALPAHRDAEPFETLRAHAEAQTSAPEALLATLGPLPESRARVGFAAGFFAAGGIRTRESTADEEAVVACICGSDERYATEAAARARALKAAGCQRVLLAGRPGALEATLREAGVDGFIFVGCDVIATLSELFQVFPGTP
ncbi:methylmalonyl-CoA mutase family protein [Pendulispora albinea]|uniref:methylmalonyl-CoA mutase n=1 Tax=Pendulispora albinea TaxID=2741071 RepID=A0ABZ2LR53_9BACT